MTRLQKVIIVVLGVLNIVVIVVLGNIVVWNMLKPRADVVPLETSRVVPDAQRHVGYCPNTVIASLPLYLHPMVDWEGQQLKIVLQDVYTTTTPPATSAQHLWTAMDAVAAALRAGCAPPSTITLAMRAQGHFGPNGVTEIHHHIAKLEGRDIMAWTVGALSNEVLANQTAYRQIVISDE